MNEVSEEIQDFFDRSIDGESKEESNPIVIDIIGSVIAEDEKELIRLLGQCKNTAIVVTNNTESPKKISGVMPTPLTLNVGDYKKVKPRGKKKQGWKRPYKFHK